MKRIKSNKELTQIIKKKSSIQYIKDNKPELFNAINLGAHLMINNINNLEDLEKLLNIKDTLTALK